MLFKFLNPEEQRIWNKTNYEFGVLHPVNQYKYNQGDYKTNST